MHLERLLLVVLYTLAAVSCLGVVNARGKARMTLSVLLAIFCLGAALWATGEARAARLAGGTMVPGALRTAEVAPAPAAVAPARIDPSDGADLLELLAATRALHGTLAAEDLSDARALSDADYAVLERRVADHRARAWRLREHAARRTAAPPAGQEAALEALVSALRDIDAAANDLQEFFRAPSREAELRLLESARTALQRADAPLRSAESFSPVAR